MTEERSLWLPLIDTAARHWHLIPVLTLRLRIHLKSPSHEVRRLGLSLQLIEVGRALKHLELIFVERRQLLPYLDLGRVLS